MKRICKIVSVALCAVVALVLVGALPQVNASADTVSRTAGTVAVSGGGLNVRSQPTTSSTVKKVLLKGEHVTLISKTGNWWYVQYSANDYGYCSADYISQLTDSYEAYVATDSGKLNIRTGPSTSYSVRTTLSKGTKVVVIGSSGDFYKIVYNGKSVGYASKKFIRAAASSDGVSLKVDKYYQTDKRWSGMKLGSSGKTIGEIGCTVTCLAMSETFVTGTTVTPDKMASQLKFTAGGALYWPSDYTLYTGSDYYSRIAEALKSGRPVIYGGRTSAGATHWVIITGYNGQGLSAENFTINDPATSRNTTLAQHIAKYPNFIRIAYHK